MQHPSRPTEPRQETVDLAAGLRPGLAARAAGDEADAFCHEDFDELVAAGYTAITVPADLGGMGATALDLVAAQSRLAEGEPGDCPGGQHAPARVGLLGEGFQGPGGAVPQAGRDRRGDPGRRVLRAPVGRELVVPGHYRNPLPGVATVCRGPRRSSPAGRGPPTCSCRRRSRPTAAGSRSGSQPRPERGIRVLGDWKAMGMRATATPWPSTSWRSCRSAWSPPGSRWRPTSWSGRTGRGRRSPACSWARPRRRSACDRRPAQASTRPRAGLAELPGCSRRWGRCACGWTRPGRPRSPPSPGRPTPTRWPTTGAWPGPSCPPARPPSRSAPWPCGPPAAAATCAPARWSGCCATPTPACSCPCPTTPPSSGWAGSSSGRERPRRGVRPEGSGAPKGCPGLSILPGKR